MNLHSDSRLGWLILAVGMAIVGGRLALPPVARAECGGYVHTSGAPAEAMSHQATAEQAHPPGAPAPGPCPGPNCSSRGGLPLLPPASPPPSVQDQWGCVITLVSSPEWNRSFRSEQNRVRPIDQSAAIYHPPRLV